MSCQKEEAQSLCRACLVGGTEDLVPLMPQEDGSLAEMFTLITSIHLQEGDRSSQMCAACREELLRCYRFRSRCILSDDVLKSLLSEKIDRATLDIKGNKLDIACEIPAIAIIKHEEEEEVTDVQYLEDLSDDDFTVQEARTENETKYLISLSGSQTHLEQAGVNKKIKTRFFFCSSCDKKFKKIKSLRLHMKKKHAGEEKANACGECNEAFSSERELQLHAAVHAPGPVWRCAGCAKDFHARARFRRHVRRHLAPRHACARCGKRFAEPHALRRHARVHSGQPAPRAHACHLCDKRYSNNSLLTAHVARHSGLRPCACAACGKTFPTARLLASHALVHSDHKPHACPHCDKRFRHESTLRTHLRTHTGEKPYVCSVCGKTFIQNSNLTLHMRTHTGERPYACGVCARRFTSGSSLKAHARTHTGEKPYSCEICGKRFARLDLRAHLRLHTGERPFACSACPKAFASAARLRDHTRIHTGEKPYHCAQCPQKYSTKSHLAKHLKTHEVKPIKQFVVLQHIEESPLAEKVVYTTNADHDGVAMELETETENVHKDALDIGEQVPLEVSSELVLQENGEVKTELAIVDDQNANICLTGGVIVSNDVNYPSNVNVVTVNEEEVNIATNERGVKLYQLDQSLVQIHSADGQLTISQITSKMTANF